MQLRINTVLNRDQAHINHNRCWLARYMILTLFSFYLSGVHAQSASLSGRVIDEEGLPLELASVVLGQTSFATASDKQGYFSLPEVPPGTYELQISHLGFQTFISFLDLGPDEEISQDFVLELSIGKLDEIVVTGTLKEVKRLDSPVPVEVYRPVFFQKNPTPNIYQALQNVNGVRPQLNCQVCNTGDIHINGLEGPYTMVLIDGMPIVSSLASVYGLSGIPNSMVEQVEIVKGPASSLYGSEAIGGLINIITKSAQDAPRVSADMFTTSWGEYNGDFGAKFNLRDKASVLTGVNLFHYDGIIDRNADNFTDIANQERISVFQKWSFTRNHHKLFTIAGRYYSEARWGGDIHWTPTHRGSSDIYGEAINTERWEILSQYHLPTKEDILLSLSFNSHQQNSDYGDTPYLADQKIVFGQITWAKETPHHSLLAGTALRYTYYDDNTPATGGDASSPLNHPDEIWLPGLFAQDEISISDRYKLLLGLRYDYNDAHGHILTPRLAFKWSVSDNDILRINAGTGFRVVNLFTEDHAALTGARDIVIAEKLKPERSYNVNANYSRKYYMESGGLASIELSAWYTHFSNLILPDYETNSNQIIYDNLSGSAESRGVSLNSDLSLPNGLAIMVGTTWMDVSSIEDGIRRRQLLTESFTGTWSVSKSFLNRKILVDYTGNIYGPMELPLLGYLDPRPAKSPWWSIQNIQLTYKGFKDVAIYGGVKNLLNWTPWKGQSEPIIARAFDPFDKEVNFDENGQALPTINNPYALTFDPSYVYGPNQGIRVFAGLRYSIQ